MPEKGPDAAEVLSEGKGVDSWTSVRSEVPRASGQHERAAIKLIPMGNHSVQQVSGALLPLRWVRCRYKCTLEPGSAFRSLHVGRFFERFFESVICKQRIPNR
jgi:hypothetical protein